MIKIKKKYNLVLGILIGFVLAQLVMFEGYLVISEKEITKVLGLEIGNFIKLVAVLVFFLTIALFSTKKFKNINFDRLSIYLILVVIISLVVSLEGTIIISRVMLLINPNIQYGMGKNTLLFANFGVLIVLTAIFLFLFTFVFLVNRKVKYIKLLTNEIKKIKNEGFGRTIKVNGGDELAELCQSINTMSVELGEKIEYERRIEASKNELITNISHDLKTPLTSIIGYIELLKDEDIDKEIRNKYTQIAYNKSLRLKSLINELFEYTKLASGDIKFEKRKVNVSMLLNQAVGESIVNFIDKDIEVVLDNPYEKVFSRIDSVQMLRVFDNLIKNAEKYADSHSQFKVSLKVNDGNILISFTNKCTEIEEEDLKNFFNKFYRQDKSRHKEGSGLGLAIVKEIVEHHEGTITVEKLGDDITFNVALKELKV